MARQRGGMPRSERRQVRKANTRKFRISNRGVKTLQAEREAAGRKKS